MTQGTRKLCAVAAWSGKACAGEVSEVVLSAEPQTQAWPERLDLCQYHRNLELMEWGIRTFFQKYPVSRKKPRAKGTRLLEEFYQTSDFASGGYGASGAECREPQLYFNAPETLEALSNADSLASVAGAYHWRAGYEHLKHVTIDLDQARLTDRQLTAVCLVFYGGVKKSRAAQAMSITSQAVGDHIKAALKKIADKIR